MLSIAVNIYNQWYRITFRFRFISLRNNQVEFFLKYLAVSGQLNLTFILTEVHEGNGPWVMSILRSIFLQHPGFYEGK